MPTVIKVSNLSKIYRLGEIGTGTISHDLERWFKMRIRGQADPFLKIGETNVSSKKGVSDVVYALRDINFEVQQGETLGIIGKNGAGKSTLLKIISRVTGPTSGKINIKGRVASLLEVGTGFHPELTGLENIYLNGAILGMRKKEIARKLDEIIDFSGVERYIDTPVKRYSSGMYVRLAFAVAAHLESEIMIVDEVLAVGDAEFQKKCLGKMGELGRGEGRTVLFVSHKMGAIENLCKRCLLIKDGQLLMDGDTKNIIDNYLNLNSELSQIQLFNRTDRIGIQSIVFQKVSFLNSRDEIVTSFSSGDCIKFRVYFKKYVLEVLENCRLSLAILKDDRPYIVLSSELIIYNSIKISKSGFIDFIIEKCPLSKGSYFVTLFIESNSIILDWINNAVQLDIEDGNFYGTGKSYPTGWEGKTVLVNHSITIEEQQ